MTRTKAPPLPKEVPSRDPEGYHGGNWAEQERMIRERLGPRDPSTTSDRWNRQETLADFDNSLEDWIDNEIAKWQEDKLNE